MSSYFIFALILTMLYIVYCAVNITCDLYEKKETEKTDKEVLGPSPIGTTEGSVEVSESGAGFSIGNETYDTKAVTAPPMLQNGGTGKKGAVTKERLERLKAKTKAQMEEIAPYLSDGFTNEEMYKVLASRGHLDNHPCLK